MHVQVQDLVGGMGALRTELTEVHGNVLPTAERVVKDLKTEIDALYGKTERTIINIQGELTRLANVPIPPPQVFNVTVPHTPGVGDNSKRTGRAFMYLKGVTKMDIYKGTGWLKWRNKFVTLVRMAYPENGLECLEGAAKAKEEVGDFGLLTLTPTVDINMQ